MMRQDAQGKTFCEVITVDFNIETGFDKLQDGELSHYKLLEKMTFYISKELTKLKNMRLSCMMSV